MTDADQSIRLCPRPAVVSDRLGTLPTEIRHWALIDQGSGRKVRSCCLNERTDQANRVITIVVSCLARAMLIALTRSHAVMAKRVGHVPVATRPSRHSEAHSRRSFRGDFAMTTAPAMHVAFNSNSAGHAGHDDNGDVFGMLSGVGALLTLASALLPGLMPSLLLAVVFTLPLVLPLVVLGAALGLVTAFFIGLWRVVVLVASSRRRSAVE
jgi:hypothetical protein